MAVIGQRDWRLKKIEFKNVFVFEHGGPPARQVMSECRVERSPAQLGHAEAWPYYMEASCDIFFKQGI